MNKEEKAPGKSGPVSGEHPGHEDPLAGPSRSEKEESEATQKEKPATALSSSRHRRRRRSRSRRREKKKDRGSPGPVEVAEKEDQRSSSPLSQRPKKSLNPLGRKKRSLGRLAVRTTTSRSIQRSMSCGRLQSLRAANHCPGDLGHCPSLPGDTIPVIQHLSKGGRGGNTSSEGKNGRGEAKAKEEKVDPRRGSNGTESEQTSGRRTSAPACASSAIFCLNGFTALVAEMKQGPLEKTIAFLLSQAPEVLKHLSRCRATGRPRNEAWGDLEGN